MTEQMFLFVALVCGIAALNWWHLSSRTVPADVSLWHKWHTTFPVRLTNGKFSRESGQLWRRRQGGKWEFTQEPETYEDFLDRQW